MPWTKTILLAIVALTTTTSVVAQEAACSANSLCSHLAGDCCPNDAGVDLFCCEKTLALCSENPACAAEGLADACCPTVGFCDDDGNIPSCQQGGASCFGLLSC